MKFKGTGVGWDQLDIKYDSLGVLKKIWVKIEGKTHVSTFFFAFLCQKCKVWSCALPRIFNQIYLSTPRLIHLDIQSASTDAGAFEFYKKGWKNWLSYVHLLTGFSFHNMGVYIYTIYNIYNITVLLVQGNMVCNYGALLRYAFLALKFSILGGLCRDLFGGNCACRAS